jgi:hypothetical protein
VDTAEYHGSSCGEGPDDGGDLHTVDDCHKTGVAVGPECGYAMNSVQGLTDDVKPQMEKDFGHNEQD